MSMEVPMSGRVPGIVGEVGSARQLPNQNVRPRTKKRPQGGHSEESETFEPPDLADESDGFETSDDGDADDFSLAAAADQTLTDSFEIEASDDGDADDLSPTTADGLTLTDPVEIAASDDRDADDLSLATANGLTLSDVKAAYGSK